MTQAESVVVSFQMAWNFLEGIYRFQCQERELIILDFGANIGLSVIFLKRLFPEAKLFVCGANPYIFRFLEENVSRNVSGRVALFREVVWTSAGEVGAHRKLEELVGRRLTVFSYPFGNYRDFNAASVAVCRECGFFRAAANYPGQWHPGCDPLAVPRHLVRNWGGEFQSRMFRFKYL